MARHTREWEASVQGAAAASRAELTCREMAEGGGSPFPCAWGCVCTWGCVHRLYACRCARVCTPVCVQDADELVCPGAAVWIQGCCARLWAHPCCSGAKWGQHHGGALSGPLSQLTEQLARIPPRSHGQKGRAPRARPWARWQGQGAATSQVTTLLLPPFYRIY